MLDTKIKQQLKDVLGNLSSSFTLLVRRNAQYERSAEFSEFVEEVAACSSRLSTVYEDGPDFRILLLRDGTDTGISFRGLPNGHEFTSLLLALLNADGKGRNLPDEALSARIRALRGPLKLTTYVSLTCTNCPDVVQALNVMALCNDRLTHEMVDGGLFQEEVTRLGIQSVPSVYLNGELLHIGRGSLGSLLEELEEKAGPDGGIQVAQVEHAFDVVVVGGGPAGAAAAVYSARKGLKVAVVAERIGGQVNDTTDIANLIATPHTTGTRLASDLRTHLEEYGVEIFDNRKVTAVDLQGREKRIDTRGGERFVAPAVIIATGATWRRLGLPKEEQYIGRGIHFCPHCDGPFYKDKEVAVIGGGNSGVEAAIDLAGICRRVTLLEFGEKLKADEVLQQKARSLGNMRILTMAQTTELLDDGQHLTGLKVKDRQTEEVSVLHLDGVFVQIGLMPNSAVFKGAVPMTPRNEVIIDAAARTAVPGVYAAGDVTTVPYKQITIAMGEGAKAALSAFDDRIKWG